MRSVAAIVVCFHPDPDKLGRLIAALDEAVGEIIVFDNGGLDPAALPQLAEGRIRVLSRGGDNLGVATALNLACQQAWEDGYRYAVTFDQDSLPAKEMVAVLLAELQAWQHGGSKVAAIGPQLVDVRAGARKTARFLVVSRLGRQSVAREGTQPVSFLITSGCLFDLRVWALEARFDDRLFIDLVDLNWCWQLAGRGYTILGTTKTTLVHELSGGLKETRWITLTRYGGARRYFQCRNGVYHLLHVSLSPGGKLFVLKYIVSTMISAAWADDTPRASLWQCLRGLAHGALRKMGPFRP
jgi:rhamnosyltransferase